MRKTEDYLKLPYTLVLKREEDGSYFISVKELEGCFSVGSTAEEAIEMIEDAKREWIAFSIDNGLEIPEPESSEIKSYSGKFLVRVTPALHKQLSIQAKANGLSLNYHVSEILSGKSSIIENQKSIIDSFATAFNRQLSKSMTSGTGEFEVQKTSRVPEWKSGAIVLDFPGKRKRM